MKRTGWLARRTPLRPVSGKRRRENRVRTAVVRKMRADTDARCAMCGRNDRPVYGHERLGRSQGGDITRPDVLLCNRCNGWCEDNPRLAAEQGWKISKKYDAA